MIHQRRSQSSYISPLPIGFPYECIPPIKLYATKITYCFPKMYPVFLRKNFIALYRSLETQKPRTSKYRSHTNFVHIMSVRILLKSKRNAITIMHSSQHEYQPIFYECNRCISTICLAFSSVLFIHPISHCQTFLAFFILFL